MCTCVTPGPSSGSPTAGALKLRAHNRFSDKICIYTFQKLPKSLVHYETRSPIAQAGLELSMWTRLVLKLLILLPQFTTPSLSSIFLS